jgi:hypothetical protein
MDEEPKRRWLKNLPYIGLALSITILVFQVVVLHGWHMKLSSQMTYVTRKLSQLK